MKDQIEKGTVFTEVTIAPHHSGFGMWQAGELHVSSENSFGMLSDLEYAGELIPIEAALADEEFQAAGVEDIRGHIYNEPSRIYARIVDGTVTYSGVVESEVPGDFFA